MGVAKAERERTEAYHQRVDEVLTALGTDVQQGLSGKEALARLDTYGKNELMAENPVPVWKKFLAQFPDALVILLLIATVISAGLWVYERESALPYGEATIVNTSQSGFPSAGHLRIAHIGWTIPQVHFVCAVSVPVGDTHEEAFKGYGT